MKFFYLFLHNSLLAKQLRHITAALAVICFALLPVELFSQAPVITFFAPLSGPVGTPVTLTGTNFNATVAGNIVFFGATKATVTAASLTSLTVTVPTGAAYGVITVLNTGTSLAAYSQKFFLPTFAPNKGSIAATDFAAKVDFTTGAESYTVAIGDIDGDGNPDVVITDLTNNIVSVLRNTGSPGSPGFAAKVDLPTGSFPVSVAIGDINGDGKPDLAVANNGDNTISVLLNTSSPGNISFTAKKDFGTGFNPFFVAISDMDGDGKPDLVVPNLDANTVSVLRNTGSLGTIGFAAKVDFATGSGAYSIALGDIDGDGKPDLVVPNYSDNTVSVLLNTGSPGSISFAARTSMATGINPYSVAIGDIDGDGKPDIVTANSGSNTVSVLLNAGGPGSVSFAAKVDRATGTDPVSVAIGDMDGDGKPDLAVANHSASTISVLRNMCSPGSASLAAKVDIAAGSIPTILAIGDLDGDGKPDFVTANFSSQSVSVLRNNPLFPPVISSFTPASGPVGTAVTLTGARFNAAAANNIVFFGATRAAVTAASTTSLTVTVPKGAAYGAITVLNKGTSLAAYSQTFFLPTFTPNQGSITAADFQSKADFTTGSNPYSVAIGDIDGDGKPDLVIANYFDDTISILLSTGSSGSVSFAAKVDLPTGGGPQFVAIGDIDGDGKPDLAVANNSDNTVSVLRNTSSHGVVSFAAKVDFTTGAAPASVAIGDIDGDGKPDLAVANSGSNTVSVLRNTGSTGSLGFAAKVDLATGSGPYSVALGDIDGDGKPDLAATNAFSSTVSVLRNTSSAGSVSFTAKADLATGTLPLSVAIGDIDGDGKPDLVTADAGNSSVSVLLNTGSPGSISFAAKADFITGSNPQSVAIGDLDGDGKPDLAVGNLNDNTVSVLRNTGSAGNAGFAAKVDLATGSNPQSVAIGDIDGDGKPDLAVANYNSNTVSVLRNNAVLSSVATLSDLVVMRLKNGNPSTATFTPGFSSGTNSYSIDAPNSTSTVTVTPTVTDPTATVKVNGSTVVSGTVSPGITLNVGPNTITTAVTAQDGVTTDTYTVSIDRRNALGQLNNFYEPVSVNRAPDPQFNEDGIMVHPALSPNGDGIDDVFTIDGLISHPDNKVTIMNREGFVIYQAQGYDNTTKVFDGHSNINGVMQLPGTYFYSLEYQAGGDTKRKTGFIILKY